MKKENCFTGYREENKRGHAELDSASSTLAVSQENSHNMRGRSQIKFGMTFLFDNDTKKGFTLIELLVVVLIIGILAAVALPQYQKAVEKARMVEAVSLVRTIANANKIFYLQNGRWAEHDELDLLDINIPGEVFTYKNGNRVQTNYFIYSPNGTTEETIAMAQRVPFNSIYTIFVSRAEPDRIQCLRSTAGNAHPTEIQKKLCAELQAKGTL